MKFNFQQLLLEAFFDVMRIFGRVEPNSNLPIFQDPSSTLEEIEMRTRGLFWTKFNSKKLLFEAFFNAMRIFGSVEPQIEYNLPFPYRIILRSCQSFETSNSTPGGDRHMLSQPFLDQI